MSNYNHKHVQIIKSRNKYHYLISILEDSMTTYTVDNLSIHLHPSQIKLLKRVRKYSKKHHHNLRVEKYSKISADISDDKHFNIHKKKYLERYKKLEKLGLIDVDTDSEELPFEYTLTSNGISILEEIDKLEGEWEKIVFKEMNNELLDNLKDASINAQEITYNSRKAKKYIF
ncbi:MAG: hypothetical protein BZ136_09060 [Methanosphaera sp. rholeuAM74]|nr:MAG: hypothetical protein BZ136_09060 [Methanosphaera sp. rholeuAM74]